MANIYNRFFHLCLYQDQMCGEFLFVDILFQEQLYQARILTKALLQRFWELANDFVYCPLFFLIGAVIAEHLCQVAFFPCIIIWWLTELLLFPCRRSQVEWEGSSCDDTESLARQLPRIIGWLTYIYYYLASLSCFFFYILLSCISNF